MDPRSLLHQSKHSSAPVMDAMFNITAERQKFYASAAFKDMSKNKDVEVVYTWEMDLNRSLLGASTILVPRATTASPPAPLMPPWAHNSWICVFSIMLIIAVGGNAIVIWIVIAHKRMRTVTNYFLVNLSLADLMMSALNCLFNFIYMLHSDWVFGLQYCKISNFIANVTVAASVFTLTGISFDRFQAIVRPMRPRMSKTCSLIAIGGIWLGGMVLATPYLLYSTTKEYKSRVGVKTACLLVWPDGMPDVSKMDFVFRSYFRMAIMCRWLEVMWRRRHPLDSPPECPSQSNTRSRSATEECRGSKGNTAAGWAHHTRRIRSDPPSPRLYSHASCRKCPGTNTYDPFIHGRRV